MYCLVFLRGSYDGKVVRSFRFSLLFESLGNCNLDITKLENVNNYPKIPIWQPLHTPSIHENVFLYINNTI